MHQPRKRNMLQPPVDMGPCPFCGRPVTRRDSSVIYGRSYGLSYICTGYPECQSYVGCHKGDGRPLGTLADEATREARKRAHAAFDPIWRRRAMRRADAYAWLAASLGIEAQDCHIGLFTVAQCDATCAVIEECSAVLASHANDAQDQQIMANALKAERKRAKRRRYRLRRKKRSAQPAS